ncbi:MAG: hypothetical protein HON66_03770 [Formosa sp.]|jgi:hypothetical protein|nr:hypothetical protein [Formosa sp.]MDB2426353.1 hypothetical protein [Flavobacteriaceae bacterium]MDC0463418.1 hypothetical protein [Flavobacteriaceae bacterium]MDC3350425.1 hypothetical protein [Flavobacteriaceae bacterium]|tara:strand:- start:297 stop:719 length:423 start_codon:yes stop_codon:yes gene_type:complete
MNKIIYFFILTSLSLYSQSENEIEKSTIVAKKILIQDNVERVIFDYTQSDEMGLIEMHAPFGWTEPIIKAQFEIRGIVLKGVLGLQYDNNTQTIISGNGFIIPKNTLVRIFNAGEVELVLIEVLRPAYKKELVQEFKSFN